MRDYFPQENVSALPHLPRQTQAHASTMVPMRELSQGQQLAPAQPGQRQHSHSSSGWHFQLDTCYSLTPCQRVGTPQHSAIPSHFQEKPNIHTEPARFWGNATVSLCLGENSP